MTDPIVITLVAGTEDWEWPDTGENMRWWQSQSEYTALMRGFGCQRHGWRRHGCDLPPWSTALAGTFFSGRDFRSWWRGALGLAEDLETLPVRDRNLICHSHAGNLGVMVASDLQRSAGGLNSLVTICTPRRRDKTMQALYEAVECPWLHIYCKHVWSNRMQWMGARGASWMMPAPAQNAKVKGIGHSELLRQPRRFEHIHREIIIPFLRPRARRRSVPQADGDARGLDST